MTKPAQTTETRFLSRSSAAGRVAGALVAALLTASVTGCVETGLYEKAALDLDGARRANLAKEQQIRVLQWQLDTAGQQARAVAEHDANVFVEMERQLQSATSVNGDFAVRLAEREREVVRLTLAVARAEEEASSKHGPPGAAVRLRPEDLKRIEAAASAHDAEMTRLLARVEKLLAEARPFLARPGERPPRVVEGDLVDPWAGHRK